MRNAGRSVLLPVLLMIVSAAPAWAQTVTGTLRDQATTVVLAQMPISLIDAKNKKITVNTDAQGAFDFKSVRHGSYTLSVEKAGRTFTHGPFTLIPKEVVQLEVVLREDSALLSVQTTTSRVAKLAAVGFYERFASTNGQFLLREDIERKGGRALSEVLNGVRGVRIAYGNVGGDALMRSASGAGALSALGGTGSMCRPAIYVEGVLVRQGGSDASLVLDQVEHPDRVEAIEVYSSTAQLPPQYGGSGGACGVILIWTKGR